MICSFFIHMYEDEQDYINSKNRKYFIKYYWFKYSLKKYIFFLFF